MRISIEEKKLITDRILAVAERQVAENGLSAVTLRTIADEADIKTGALYNHFRGGLDEVFLMVNSRTIKLLDDLLAEAVNGSDDTSVAKLFERMALAYLHFAIDYPHRFRALFEHQMKNGEPIPEWHLQDLYMLFRHVEKPLDDLNHDISSEQRHILARTIYSSVHGIVQLGLQGHMIALPVPALEQQLKVITKVLATGLSALAADLAS